jgi:hypothetical protein
VVAAVVRLRARLAWLAPLCGVIALSFVLLLVAVVGTTLLGGLVMVASWFLVLTSALGLVGEYRRASEEALADQAMRVRVLEGALVDTRTRLEAAESRLSVLAPPKPVPVATPEPEAAPAAVVRPWWRFWRG